MPVGAAYRPRRCCPSSARVLRRRGAGALPAAHAALSQPALGGSASASTRSTEDEWARHFAGFVPLPGNLAEPLALRYHGHQFRIYNPDLGDGRGFVFAQLRDAADGRLLDLGTKGSGQTPWSRGGDGRLTLKGGVREVLASEMLEALGVYTSKGFSLFETGESLHRSDEPSPTRASVLVRLEPLAHPHRHASSACAYRANSGSLRRCSSTACEHYVPRSGRRDGHRRRLLRAVARRSAGSVRVVDGRGLRARRAQHRQHERDRRELRLRPVSLPARHATRASSPPTSTRAGCTPSAASRRPCCGTSSAWPSRCCRSARRRRCARRCGEFGPRYERALCERLARPPRADAAAATMLDTTC